MSHLIPVVRPDANGKMVTRHVRASQPLPAAAALTIPRVQKQGFVAASGSTIEAAKGRRVLLSSITTSFRLRETVFLKHSLQELAGMVRELPDSTMESFHAVKMTVTDTMELEFLSRLVIKALDCGTGTTDIESAIHYYGQSSTYERGNIDEYFEVGAKKLAVYPIGNLLSAVKSYDLDGFNFNPELPLGKQDERTVQQCNALRELHYVAERAEHWDANPQKPFSDYGTLVDSRLAQMIVDRPEIINEVTEVIYDRETLDYDFISSILGNDAQAMREGTL